MSNSVAVDPVRSNDADFMDVFDAQYAVAFGEGAIPAKYKELSGVTLSVALRCEACLIYHVKMAIDLKASRVEITEAMRIGIVAGGSAGIPTMRGAYRVMDEAGLA